MNLVLASASPRRRELLKAFGYQFVVAAANTPEEEAGVPTEVAEINARRKAAAISKDYPDSVVLGADTIVVLDDEILGKPQNPRQAEEMLAALSGREHQVITGTALYKQGLSPRIFHEVTLVKFRQLKPAEISAYANSSEPLDKAGGYGIQGMGGLFVESISGCFFNVVGLPVPRIAQELTAFGISYLSALQGGRKEV